MGLLGKKKIRVAAPHLEAEAAGSEHVDDSPNESLKTWFAAFQKPIFDKYWAQTIAGMFCAIAVAEAIALMQLIPLKEKVPMFIGHDENTGAAWVDHRVAQVYSPTTANKTYFLKVWANWLLTIKADPQITINEDIPTAEGWTTGDAVKQVSNWVLKEDRTAERIAETPGLTRTFTSNSTSYSADGKTAYMVVTIQESIKGTPQPPVQRLLTIGVAFMPEKLQEGEEDLNPLGTRITSFTNTPYIGPGSTR
jgi:type IV secretion system protein VirB8